ncbi:membrane-associated protein, putative [Bodo saltans]|uniref:Membrane-associated protein, putative n=1 Tax=Bodo saltans TaxID=75058 RepID=A0A0S4J544_BODSA|nr:membrane-associated protein, putative [Bodo saltans]|eukprot:CUG82341.1 membrane-associated protein, putative [Bodo saltans]
MFTRTIRRLAPRSSEANTSGSSGSSFSNGLAFVGVMGFIPGLFAINTMLPSTRKVSEVWMYQGSDIQKARGH